MVAAINYALAMYQKDNINTAQDFNRFNKSVEALQYTPYVDFALTLICAVGLVIALPSPLALGLGVLGVIFWISGMSQADTDSVDAQARLVSLAWRARVALEQIGQMQLELGAL